MLLVSHEPRTIAQFCSRALLLDGGRIIMSGPAEAVAERYLSLLTGDKPVAPPQSSTRRKGVR